MAANPRNKSRAVQLDPVALNETLVLSLVREHELNERLQAEIFARERAEGALIRSEKLASVGRMAAVLAHEINNPLEAVMNILFIAQTAEDIPDHIRNYLESADGELRRIAHITRQTLGFYREAASPTTFRVSALLDSIIDLLRAKIVSSRATIAVRCDTELRVTAFQGEVRQVLSNLLRNSLDAVPESGTIKLRAARASATRDGRSCIRISVSDNGHGISSIALQHIFQPFFTTKGLTGNGLGLWVSKQIVEKHKGTIQVRSRTNGAFRGTTFSVTLPEAVSANPALIHDSAMSDGTS